MKTTYLAVTALALWPVSAAADTLLACVEKTTTYLGWDQKGLDARVYPPKKNRAARVGFLLHPSGTATLFGNLGGGEGVKLPAIAKQRWLETTGAGNLVLWSLFTYTKGNTAPARLVLVQAKAYQPSLTTNVAAWTTAYECSKAAAPWQK